MTFTEAAEAVLRKAGKALSYKKITQLSIDQNLLSHIGKTPEVTMSTRLATLTKKDSPDQNIVRVRPGVFGLREWGPNVAVDAEVSDDDAAEAKPATAPADPDQTAGPDPSLMAHVMAAIDRRMTDPRDHRIAVALAESLGVNPRPFLVAVMMAASAGGTIERVVACISRADLRSSTSSLAKLRPSSCACF
jgi:hypothetical protein